MTMKAIQGTAASYQGGDSAAPKTQNVQNVTTTQKIPEQTSGVSATDSSEAMEEGQQPENNQQEAASDSSLKKAVDEINRSVPNTEVIFGYHEGTNRVIIKIVDKDTKELKREYPAEKTLDMLQKVWEMAGLMVDEKR